MPAAMGARALQPERPLLLKCWWCNTAHGRDATRAAGNRQGPKPPPLTQAGPLASDKSERAALSLIVVHTLDHRVIQQTLPGSCAGRQALCWRAAGDKTGHKAVPFHELLRASCSRELGTCGSNVGRGSLPEGQSRAVTILSEDTQSLLRRGALELGERTTH